MINNRYTIIKKIGEGRSKVFLCVDKFFPNEKIAIKILQYTANDSEINFFNNEYRIIKRLTHPNIISVHDKGSIFSLPNEYKTKYKISENDKFITMEWVDGIKFNECTKLNNEAELLSVIKQISLALYYIHQANYIYFDLKPDNILIYNTDVGLRVKIIDFGLAVFYPDLDSNFTKGTAEYLAPEILKNDEISFNADLYSFGILLYHFAYHKFPFRTENDLEIFRAQLEKDFEFPSSKVSSKIIAIIKKMLLKNPKYRFTSSLEIIHALGQNITFEEKINLTNTFSYVERLEAKSKINYFLDNEVWGKVTIVTGEKGIGKSRFLESVSNEQNNLVLIKTANFISSANFWQQFFSRLIYSEAIYRSIDDSLIQYVLLHIDDNSQELLVELKTIISKIASITNFCLVIEDFNQLESKNIEIFNELFPILLGNQIKIILSTDNIKKVELSQYFSQEVITLEPFNNEEIHSLVQRSYNNFVDKKELENLIVSFSDRNPARVFYFISELIASNMFDFLEGKVILNVDDYKIDKLLASHENIFELQRADLSDDELSVSEIISLFENDISIELISFILELSVDDIQITVKALRDKNILQPSNTNRNPSFINNGFKKYIYSKIIDVEKWHLISAHVILEHFPQMEVFILINQFELANDIKGARTIISQNLDDSKNINYPQIRIKYLIKLLSYKSSNEEKVENIIKLCDLYTEIGKYNEALALISELNTFELDKNSKQIDYMAHYL